MFLANCVGHVCTTTRVQILNYQFAWKLWDVISLGTMCMLELKQHITPLSSLFQVGKELAEVYWLPGKSMMVKGMACNPWLCASKKTQLCQDIEMQCM